MSKRPRSAPKSLPRPPDNADRARFARALSSLAGVSHSPSPLGYQLKQAELYAHAKGKDGTVRRLPTPTGDYLPVRDDGHLWRRSGREHGPGGDVAGVALEGMTDGERAAFVADDVFGGSESQAVTAERLGVSLGAYRQRLKRARARERSMRGAVG